MRISKNLFNSKVSQRIAMLLFIAAFIPATLMTFLSDKKVTDLVTAYEHKLLIEESRSYALSVFSNLTFARNRVEDAIQDNQAIDYMSSFTVHSGLSEYSQFNSVAKVLPDGTIADSNSEITIPQDVLRASKKNKKNKAHILILPNSNGWPSINFLIRDNNNKSNTAIYLFELNSNYLWGEKSYYPSDKNLCVYQISNDIQTSLFCSNDYKAKNNATNSSPVNIANWELFLNGEFNSDPWLFEINRLTPISSTHIKEFVGSKAYIGVAILSLLIVGLLSLIQIRRTMVPLEKLIKSAKNITSGKFSNVQVDVDGSSEFSDLADAFNSMSSHIEHQLDTMESFSIIDKEIASKVDIEHAIQLVMKRMQVLAPNSMLLVAYLEEESANEVQCSCTVSGHEALSTIRLSLPVKEINAIKRYNQGQVKQSNLTNTFIHERLMAELGANNMWTLPVFWQGEMCAFVSVGSKAVLNEHQEIWGEFRDLASRIGIVISAHERDQKLLLEAQYDSLTGLPNRILLQDRLKLAMEHSDHTGKPMWIIFIDLDRFKVINDSLGHTLGDKLLVEIGNRLLAETRDTDTVARFGGDEFVIVLSGDAGENIQLSVLNRIMDSIAEPAHINNHELINTCSIGISVYPTDGKNAETLIKNADIAMYRAKEMGRNNYQFFTQSLNDKASERMQIISLLRRAIEHDELSLHYQPKVDLRTNNVVGLEALLRWNNATLGNVSPAKFIPIAEEAGLIIPIGEWVLQTACKQMAIWQKSGLGNLLMSVNLSARQLQQNNLIEKIKSTLVKTGLNAEFLELELTESMLMDSSHNFVSDLHAIKALGIQLSVDDFGTGFSNRSYLQTLPIDTLKIDKSFIDIITFNTKKAPIVDTIISLAKNMNLKIVAEGVETSEQALYLKKQDCDQIQGYYFSKPLPANAMRELLASGKKLDLPKLKLIKNTQ